MTIPLILGERPLTLADLVAVARDGRPVRLGDPARAAMAPSLQWVEALSARMRAGEPTPPIYSINTGFGSLAGREAFRSVDDAVDLSRRLIVSNASGVGRPLDEDVVRAAMLIRAASLARGHSAVRPVLAS